MVCVIMEELIGSNQEQSKLVKSSDFTLALFDAIRSLPMESVTPAILQCFNRMIVLGGASLPSAVQQEFHSVFIPFLNSPDQTTLTQVLNTLWTLTSTQREKTGFQSPHPMYEAFLNSGCFQTLQRILENTRYDTNIKQTASFLVADIHQAQPLPEPLHCVLNHIRDVLRLVDDEIAAIGWAALSVRGLAVCQGFFFLLLTIHSSQFVLLSQS